MTAPDGKLKVFISWSMPLSHDVAKILRDWLPRVIQDVEPWVSSEDIEKGTYWTEGIVQSLDAAKVGIIVVTPENHQRTWLNFEAGALARSIKASGGVTMPLLIDMDTASIQGPMTTLQIANFNREDVTKLLVAVNERTRTPLTSDLLKDQIELLWPRLESLINGVIQKHGTPKAPSLTDRDILEEVLTGVRELRRTVPIGPTRPLDSENKQAIHRRMIETLFGDLGIELVRLRNSIARPGEFVVTVAKDADEDALLLVKEELDRAKVRARFTKRAEDEEGQPLRAIKLEVD